MRILGIDPGLAIVGWAVLESERGSVRPVAFGAITTPAHTDIEHRLWIIKKDLEDLIDKYKPEEMAIEELFFNTNQKTAILVAEARGTMLLAAVNNGLKIYEYTPGFVHGKVFLSDDERAVIGSINLDYRSLYWHYECSAYLYQVPVLKEIYEDFLNTQKLCEIVTSETIKNIGFVSKFAAYILKIVAPLM